MPLRASAMNENDEGKYLYCIIRCAEERAFADVAPLGDTRGPVHTVPQDGLAMVVSDGASGEYRATRAHMQAHQKVQERVMHEYTLLPVRFGTVAGGPAAAQDIQRLLQKRRQEWEALLAEMEGKVELGLKALWRDEQATFAELLAENPPIRKLRDSLRDKPPEVVRFEGIPLGTMVKTALEQKKRQEAAGLLAPLRPIAYRTQENPVVVDRMILNAAFLVPISREADFDRGVSTLEEKLGHRVSFKYVGPTPPYNFVNIVVHWGDL